MNEEAIRRFLQSINLASKPAQSNDPILQQLIDSGNQPMTNADNVRLMQQGLLSPESNAGLNQLQEMMGYRNNLMMQLENANIDPAYRQMLMDELNNINTFLGQ